MSSTFDPTQHPRARGGLFAATERPEGDVSLDPGTNPAETRRDEPAAATTGRPQPRRTVCPTCGAPRIAVTTAGTFGKHWRHDIPAVASNGQAAVTSAVCLGSGRPVPDLADNFLNRHAAEMRRRFLADVRDYAAAYRSEATFRDADYIATANLAYVASQAAEESGDEPTILAVEQACFDLEDDPGDRNARDTCARVVRRFAATLG